MQTLVNSTTVHVRRRLRFAAVAAFMVVLATLPVGEASASGVGCGDVVTSNTILTADLFCTGTGLVVGADGITVDLGGRTIQRVGAAGFPTGIFNSGFDNVTIRNGTVSGFHFGVVAQGAVGNEISRLTLADNVSTAIEIRNGSHDNVIERNTVVGASRGVLIRFGSHNNEVSRNRMAGGGSFEAVFVHSGDGNTVARNDIAGFSQGIALRSGSDLNVIDLNTITGSGFAAINLLTSNGDNTISRNRLVENLRGVLVQGGSHRNLISDNLISASGEVGLRIESSSHDNIVSWNKIDGSRSGAQVLSGSAGNSIEANTITNNELGGIEVADSGTSYNQVTANELRANGFGVRVSKADHTLVSGNLVSMSTNDGIVVDSNTDRTLVVGNEAFHNGVAPQYVGAGDGIDIDDPDTTITMNKAFLNHLLGISAVPDVTDGGGNEAKHNGNPQQCTNVICS